MGFKSNFVVGVSKLYTNMTASYTLLLVKLECHLLATID